MIEEYIRGEIIIRFRKVTWKTLSNGRSMWYIIPGHKSVNGLYAVHGPFTVVDVDRCRLRNKQGIELELPNVQPLVIDDGDFDLRGRIG